MTRTERPGMSIVVGVTGGIGVGKSLFCELLRSEGGTIIDADRFGWEILKNDRNVKTELLGCFGEGIIGDDGEIDRKKLALLVFSDKGKLNKLNAIVHPRLLSGVSEEVARLRKEGCAVIIVDAALISEWKTEKDFDIIVLVTAPRKDRIGRLLEKGMKEKEISDRIDSQTGDDERKETADLIVENDGSIEDLGKKANEVWRKIVLLGKG
ncbi:MAG: dephospho-CoA kinase [Candidatus Eisenbacteria bacterium]|nr:dephospho-CoA kinase [Candidatus Eisenbacteria bacterium]